MIELMGCLDRFMAAGLHASKVGLQQQWADVIRYLEHYGEDRDSCGGFVPPKTLCLLYADFASHSFVFTMQAMGSDGKYRDVFTGGLIYHPAAGQVDTSLSTQAQPFHGWQVHT